MIPPKKKNWLNENITAIIAIGFFVFAFYIFRMVLIKEVKASDSVEISVVECIKGVMFLIVGYFFGSSTGSKTKGEVLERNTEPKIAEGS